MYQQDRQLNVYPYHEVYAKALAQIFQLTSTKQKEDAKELTIVSTISAMALNNKEYKIEELKKKTIYELVDLMMREQKEAGLVPVQTHTGMSFYSRIIAKAGGNNEGNSGDSI